MAVEITGQKAEVSVGEKITLGVKYTKEWGILKSVEWTIPGKIVKDYKDNQTSGKVTEIKEADKKSTKKFTIDFYWVDGGDGRVVEAKCVFTSAGKDTNKTISATFDVKAPKLDNDKFNATTDVVDLVPPAAPSSLKFGVTKAGIKWDWKVTLPSTVDGYVKDVQTIKTITKQTTTGGTKQVWTISGTKVPPADMQLDTSNPYRLPGDFGAPHGFPKKLSAGITYSDNYSVDSPRTPLAGAKRVFTHDQFKYYIMYKPDKPNAIWVPIAKAEWYWKGEAAFGTGTGKWKLVSKGGGITSSGASTKEFPKYDSNVKYNKWENE